MLLNFRRGLLAAVLTATCTLPTTALTSDALSKVDPSLLTAAQTHPQLEFLIRMGTAADLSMSEAARTREARGKIVVQILKAHAAASQKDLLAQLNARGLKHRSFWIANSVAATGSLADIQALAVRPDIAHIYLVKAERPNLPGGVEAASLASAFDPSTSTSIEPGLVRVGAPEVWAKGYTGQGVVVGDHDIGVEWTHPALKKKYRGWDEANQSASHDYNWRNAFEVDTYCPDPAIPCDPNSHGTHTTGTMVGSEDGGRVVGMAPNAQWIGCRSLYDDIAGAGTVPTYMDCMEFMLAPFPIGQPEMGDPSKAPDVVNNSWGCLEACAPPLLKDINDATKAAGIVQVVSAGNDGSQCMTIITPLAVYDSSFTVGASNTVDDGMASFSSRGPVAVDGSMRIKPDIVAPGVGTVSTVPGDGYGAKSGTSMAGPHVAGLVALMMSAEPRLKGRVDDVRNLIARTAFTGVASTQACGGVAASTIPNSVFGFGRIDALAAVNGIPKLETTVSAPASAMRDTTYPASITVRQADGGKIDVTLATLEVTLAPGVSVIAATPTPAAVASDLNGTTLVFSRAAALAPSQLWQIDLQLKSSSGGAKAIRAVAEGNQVSPQAGAEVITLIEAGVTPFAFIERNPVALGKMITSEEITLRGFSGSLPISVSEGAQYRINGGAFTNSVGTVHAGDTLAVRHVSATSVSTRTVSSVTVGSYNAAFVSVTTSEDTVPARFGFATLTNQAPNTLVTSAAIVPTDFDAAASVSPGPNAQYSVNGGPFTNSVGKIAPGQTLAIRHLSNRAALGYTKSYLNVGGVTGHFVTRTRQAP